MFVWFVCGWLFVVFACACVGWVWCLFVFSFNIVWFVV